MPILPSVVELEQQIKALRLWVKSMDDRDVLQAMSKQARGFVLLRIYENKKAIAELTILVSETRRRLPKWTATLEE